MSTTTDDPANPHSPDPGMAATVGVFLTQLRFRASLMEDPTQRCFVIVEARRLGCARDHMIELSLADARAKFLEIVHDIDDLAFMATDVPTGWARVVVPMGPGGMEAVRAVDVMLEANDEHDALYASQTSDGADEGSASWLLNHSATAIKLATEQAAKDGRAPETIVVTLVYGDEGTAVARALWIERVRMVVAQDPEHVFAEILPLRDAAGPDHVAVIACSQDQKTLTFAMVPLAQLPAT